jgi:putative thioredoxin
MSEMLAALAAEFAEQFVFAKVDIEENSELKEKYGIKNIPTLKIFVDGKDVVTEEGKLSEEEARALLKNYGIVNESEELRLQARQLHMQGNTQEAVMQLTLAIQQDPSNTRVAMDMVQIFIDIGELEQARQLFGKIPEQDHHSDMGKSLSGQLQFLGLAENTEGLETLSQKIISEPDNQQARFDLAICQVAQHDYMSAMDNLFHIQSHAPEFKQGAAREMIVTIVNMLMPVEPEMAQEYRRRLANMLAE